MAASPRAPCLGATSEGRPAAECAPYHHPVDAREAHPARNSTDRLSILIPPASGGSLPEMKIPSGRVALFLALFLGLPPSRAEDPSSLSHGLPSGLKAAKLGQMDAVILAAIATNATPGAVLWLEHATSSYHRAYGRRAVQPRSESMTEDTIFDAASLTKVLATTPAVLWLIEHGRVNLDDPAKTYLADFTGDGRDAITVRHLLTHASGLRPGLGAGNDWSGYDAGIRLAVAEKPEVPAGTRFRYSDINFILLGELVRRVGGEPLDAFCARHLYQPLALKDSSFRPSSNLVSRIAPTTKENGAWLRGVVHDPTARRMGGVAGHAGLFTSTADTARFARMLLRGGSLDGVQVLRPETVRLMTSVQSPPGLAEARRGLGWDIDSPYAGPRGDLFPIGSYGHSGWTGTSLWIDPFSRTFVILMSNRNHPTEDGNVLALRRKVGTFAAEAVEGFAFDNVPGALPRQAKPGNLSSRLSSGTDAGVRNGIDSLASSGFGALRRLKIGLVTNHTGTDYDRNPTIDLLKAAPEVDLRVLFSPEHGIRGALDEKVPDSVDARTGLPVFSLYGEARQPKVEQLAGLDALVFDIQDIGCRFYTYVSTMGLCLEAAARHRLQFFVLDRVNPIGGVSVEGPVYAGTNHNFVAFHQVPLRHGMTAGELARMFNVELGWNARLTVIPVEGWRRSQWFDETGLPWTNPSPNMRNLTEATLYPGVGLLESAISVGRGTDTPFEVVGAPYVNDRQLAAELNRAGLPGIRFVPVRFTPKASTFKDQSCGGVHILLLERNACPVVDVGIVLALALQRLHPSEFALNKLGPLLQHPATLEAIRAGRSLADIKALWEPGLKKFQARRAKFLLY